MLFNIIIPALNSSHTLYWTICSCLDQKDTNYQILVCDDCSDDNTREMVEKFNDPKLKYVRTPKRLSMTSTWEFALSHISEGYVIVVGHDDALLPDAISKIRTILKHTSAKVVTWQLHKYSWPNHVLENYRGMMTLKLNRNYRFFNTKEKLKKVANTFIYSDLPLIYNGVIHYDIIKRVKEKSGRFFNCLTPDVYSGFVISSEVDTFVYSYYPFSIAGHSNRSVGVSYSIAEKPDDKLMGNTHLFNNDIGIHSKLAPTRSTVVLIADALLQAREFYPKIPPINLMKVLETAYRDARILPQQNQTEILESLKVIALKNNLAGKLEHLINNFPHPENSNQTVFLKPGYDESYHQLTLDSRKIGATNIYEAALFIDHIVSQFPTHCRVNPLGVSVSDFLTRGFFSTLAKIQNKIK